MGKHAKRFQPSKAEQWMNCPGSLVLTKDIPDSGSSYADRGSDIHELAEICLISEKDPEIMRDRVMTHGNVVDDEMIECVDAYLERVLPLLHTSVKTGVEIKSSFGELVGIYDKDDCFGSLDFMALTILPEGVQLEIHDLKTGKGVKKWAKDNPQLLTYAAGIYDELRFEYDIRSIKVAIHQPPLGHYDEDIITPEDLAVFTEQLVNAVSRCEDANSSVETGEAWIGLYLNPGEAQCKFCKAKGSCPARRDEMLGAVIEGDFKDLDAAPEMKEVATLDSPYLDKVYPYLDQIQEWCSAARGELERRVKAGDPYLMERYEIVEGKKGRRSWFNPSEVGTLAQKKRLKVMFVESLLSPTQAEKLAKSGAIGPKNWAELSKHIVQPPGAPSVVPRGSGRKPLNLEATAADFTALPTTEEESFG